ncbi:MAG: alpha/beta hydrolase [Acidimicrobiia bacterium]|nr:alpha/beta hydrolase [Acidimicrobiia bacterium]MDH5620189.1 alpha/beta hydrolase [Gammaproteobacteria bacterium]
MIEVFGTRKPDLTAKTRKGLPGSFVELSAGVTHYELRGGSNDECVVLIHGNAAPYVTWDHTIEDLCAAGFRVLRYDVFGHGLSDRPKLRTYDRRFYNAQLADLLGSLDIPYPVSLVGSSQGGSTGACFAAENPGKVKKLALLSPFFDDFAGSRGIGARLVKTPFVGELLLQLMGDAKFIDRAKDIVSADTRTALEREVAEQFRFSGKQRAILANWRGDGLQDATACYESVRDQGIPVLLTWGTVDQKLFGDSMRRLRDLIPEIEYHELEGAGHLAHYEFPDRVNPPLIRFLTV